jgi:methylated-DNA-[protein]-cysteine S-methyltransferase
LVKYALVETPAGWISVLASKDGICGCSLPQASRSAALEALRLKGPIPDMDEAAFAALIVQLKAYFRGEQVDFDCPLDMAGAGEFDRAVWEATRRIPYGETRTYAFVAREIGRPAAARAVGQALGRNPLPILVPCHRVLRSDGGLGGFGGGLEMKKFLLGLERRGA